jgi:hypothetical protein
VIARRVRRPLVPLLLAVLLPAAVHAQQAQASVAGVVKDESGNVVRVSR